MNHISKFLRISFCRCNHSAFIHMFACVVFTLLSQIVLTTRFVILDACQMLMDFELSFQGLCGDIKAEACHWNLRHCHRTSIWTRCIHDISGHQGSRCVSLISSSFMGGIDVGATFFLSSQHTLSMKLALQTYTPVYIAFRGRKRRLMQFLLCYLASTSLNEFPPLLTLMADVGVFLVIMNRLLWRRPSSIKMPFVVQTIVRDATFHVLLLSTSRLIFVLLSILTTVCLTSSQQRFLC